MGGEKSFWEKDERPTFNLPVAGFNIQVSEDSDGRVGVSY